MRTRGQGESLLLLLDAVELLGAKAVPYAVIGALAASVHGVIRASLDADAVLSLPPQRLRELEGLFGGAGFHTELRFGDADDPIAAMLVLSDSHGNRVDLLAGLRGFEAAAFLRAIDVTFHGATLRVVGKEDFIAMKLFAGGPQDLMDAGQVLKSSAEVDITLLRRLAAQFGPSTLRQLERFLRSS